MPRTLRNVSCCPANEASGRSSAVALDRTAKESSSSSPASFVVRGADVGLEIGGERLLDHGGSGSACPTSASSLHVVGVEAGQLTADQLGQPGVADEPAVGVGGGGEPVRHPDPGRGQVATPSRRARSSCRRPARDRPGRDRRTTGRWRPCPAWGWRSWAWECFLLGWRRGQKTRPQASLVLKRSAPDQS